jgi:hypothetical protein
MLLSRSVHATNRRPLAKVVHIGEIAHRVVALDELVQHPLGSMLRVWSHAKRAHGLPSRNDFDLVMLRPHLARLTLADVVDRGRDYRIRLHGSALVERWGADLTGRLLSEIGPASLNRIVKRGNDDVVASGAPRCEEICYASSRAIHHYLRIILPLGEEHCGVTMLLTAVWSPRLDSAESYS